MPLWRDASFASLLAACPRLAALRAYLPESLESHAYPGQSRIDALRSSYQDHGYGVFFYALARALRPATCVEIGVLQGFSLLSVAAALRDDGQGRIVGFDLFDDYPYRHESHRAACDNIVRCGLDGRARACHADADAVHEGFTRVDWLHVDISNDGDIVGRLFKQWEGKVSQIMLFEGGSAERDQVEWMLAYGKRPIAPVIDTLRRDFPGWRFAVLAPYPSLTLAIRASVCG